MTIRVRYKNDELIEEGGVNNPLAKIVWDFGKASIQEQDTITVKALTFAGEVIWESSYRGYKVDYNPQYYDAFLEVAYEVIYYVYGRDADILTASMPMSHWFAHVVLPDGI